MPQRVIKTMHGVFMRVLQQGVLITGEPGSGKSALALALLDRGHALIADDITEFYYDECGVSGTAPTALKNKLALRSAGIFDIKTLFGGQALCNSHPLHLCLQLTQSLNEEYTLLKTPHTSTRVLDSDIITLQIPALHPTLALLAETIVRRYQTEHHTKLNSNSNATNSRA